ncbi:hypothetical protein WH47_11984 [Habropoda laboriosa]|uniref:DUF4219 domain-containing protein n=1 Tax=Habropoda laboriosa TaxID=597456 RepID=A0A0L7R0Z0_9HYME|nr:hypothetical protein WH47_11984 [Habropoda laboriosa]
MKMLSKDNYGTWRMQAEALLTKNDAWSHNELDYESLPHPVYSPDLSLFETPRPLFVREDLHQPSCC